MKHRIFYFVLIFAILIADQLTKIIIAQKIGYLNSVDVIPGFFNLIHIRNRGVIFGLFSRLSGGIHYVFLTMVSLAAFFLVVYYFFKTPTTERFLKVSLSLILAGALGNLIDRIFKGYVIDFMDFYIKKWHWPSFNLADSCITVGAIFLVFIFFFKGKSKCTPS